MSFVSCSNDIKELKSIIIRKSGSLPVIAKIERPEAVDDIDAICDVSDAVMIARGDLGVEVGPGGSASYSEGNYYKMHQEEYPCNYSNTDA